MSQDHDSVEAFTDGACSGNPGPGGWGALLRFADREEEVCGGESQTTNNRMELRGAIEALRALEPNSRVKLYTDSQYVMKGITEWIRNWKARSWKTSANKPVKNADLWRELDAARDQHEVDWVWVKGHAGHEGNERADELANRGMAAVR